MWAIALSVALSATPRHLAVEPSSADATIGDLELAVRDALRTALPGDTVQTPDDLVRAARAAIQLPDPTPDQADAVCGIACAFGRDGLVTAQRLQIGHTVRLRVAMYRPGSPVPLAEVVVPFDRNDRSATLAVQQLLAKL